MAFSGRAEDEQRLVGTPFAATAPDSLRPVAEALIVEMGGEPFWVPEEARPLYHAALTVGSNHLVTLVAESADLLRRAGVAEPGRVLGPLLFASLDNALRHGDGGLTGPVSRGDASTVAAHLETLGSYAPAGRARLHRDGTPDRGPGTRRRPPGAGAGRGVARRARRPAGREAGMTA